MAIVMLLGTRDPKGRPHECVPARIDAGAADRASLDATRDRSVAIQRTAETCGLRAACTGTISLGDGGPIAERNDVQRVLAHTTVVGGFFGVSSKDRRPTEVANTQITWRFKQISHAATAAS
jgi:predicted TIM-barrel enzyme